MKEVFVSGSTLPDAYHKALAALKRDGSVVDCSDYGQQQLECAMTVHVQAPTAEPRISRCIIGGAYDLQRYLMEMRDGILDFAIGTAWAYTYHHRFAHQLPYIIGELRRNPESRRAIVGIRDFEEDSKGSDPACLQSIQFFIRDGRLDCMVLFRSNDLPEAFFFNAFALIAIQQDMAKELGVDVGTYTHRSNSMHCYSKDFDLLNGYVNAIEARGDTLTYDYEGFYDEMMNDEIPNIEQMVRDVAKRYNITH